MRSAIPSSHGRIATGRPSRGRLSLVVLALLFLTACSDGGSPSCDTSGGTVLAATAWPKFRNDQANTGRTTVAAPSSVSSVQRLFPPEGSTIGGITATPVLAADRIYLGSNDDNVYVFDFDGVPVELEEQMDTDGPILATPVLGEDGTLFVASGDGRLYQFETDGRARRATILGSSLTASPNIGFDGTIYLGGQSGFFAGVCANGAPRFLRTTTRSESPPGVTADVEDPDDLVIVAGSSNGEVRAFDRRGRTRWFLSVSAAAAIRAAIVIDEATQRFFVADQTGRVFAAALESGDLDPQFSFRASATISASPALGREVLYVADEFGVLYAINPSDGTLLWQWSAGEEIGLGDGIAEIRTSIRSSPALSAPAGASERVIFGVDVEPADAFCRLETTCTVDADCPRVNCCSGGICTRTGTPCDGENSCEQVNFCEDGTCAMRRGDCVCSECAKSNACIAKTCTETGGACTSDDCPSENLCVRSFLYAVEGGTEPSALWRVPFDAAIGTASPAIGNDGAVYIGSEAGVLYRVTE